MPTREEVVSAGVEQDVNYLGRLFGALGDPRHKELARIVSFCMVPFVSLVIHEARAKINLITPSPPLDFSAEAAEVCARSRNSLKLFEDNQRWVAGQLEFYRNEIIGTYSDVFLGNTWLRLARFLEVDLSLFTYNDVIISTNHSAAFHMGIEPKRLLQEDGGVYVRSITEQMGRCLGALGASIDADGPMTFVRHATGRALVGSDVRADRYYRRVFNGRETPVLNGLLTAFQAKVNFATSLLVAGADALDLEYTVFKIRFVILYHVLASLARLGADPNQSLSDSSRSALEGIIGAPEAVAITDRATKGFRNILVHYDPRSAAQSLDISEPLFGLIPVYFPDHDYRSLSALVDRCAHATAQRLNNWANLH
ncbi:hypothetical protein OHA28_19235 [Streptomyces sp. NBC_00269]|uniref:hypothetical protein n=1 Tax=Streptomyces sp. NBC_00269 TaxID=2975696 RepID=UPI002E2E6E22|nr:hypothetical protein [Streptomyces sp. NBC_00269]